MAIECVSPSQLLRMFKDLLSVESALLQWASEGWTSEDVEPVIGETNWRLSQIDRTPPDVQEELRRIEKKLARHVNVNWQSI